MIINSKGRKSFTLVEILIIICAIGALISLIFPVVTQAILSSRKTSIANSMRQILSAYKNQLAQTNHPLSETDIDAFLASTSFQKNANAFIAYLVNQHHLPNSPKLCTANYDYMLKAVLKHDESAKIPIGIINDQNGMDKDFATIPTCFVLCINIPIDMPPSTPILWTRGLGTDGKWHWPSGNYCNRDTKNQSYNNGSFFGQVEGGFIGFADGTVKWYEDLVGNDGQGELFEYGRAIRTKNVLRALPPGTIQASWNGCANDAMP
ncbi:MAG: type II secretion system GspH family protein [Puniceicoccales bacterium]|jgi:Tfp pilus assembly protein PilE|nr:type II secretion system GspH family protein [Puniceicoccales bacterium]